MAVFLIRNVTWGLSDRATLMFLKFDIRQGHKSYSDMRHGHFLNSTGDMGVNKRQRHATSAFLKIDRRHAHTPVKGPRCATLSLCGKSILRIVIIRSRI